jgi:hypothetical protein
MRTARNFVLGATVVALVAVIGAPAASSAGSASARVAGASDVQAAAAADTSTMTSVMGDLENGVASGATSELVGWTLSALGLGGSGNGEFDISAQLAEINADLQAIDSELVDIDAQLKLETCELDAAETTFDATAQIGTLNTTLEQLLDAGATQEQLELFVSNVLESDTDSIPYQLTALQTALLDSGTIPGVISSCLATFETPTAGTGGDTAYYDDVSDLMAYFYGYQIEGLNEVVEAYHLAAAEAYVEANPDAVLTGDTLDTICSDATPATDSGVYCNDAVYWTAIVYQNLQQQFAFAGAPYSVAGESVTVNGSPYVFVSSLEAFTQAQTGACASVLASSEPCGPLAGTNLTTSVAPPSTFAWRTDWTPATAEQWRGALDWFTDDDQTLGTYLSDLGFENTTNSTKVVLTNTTYTAEPQAVIDGEPQAIFTSPAVCFLDTAIERKDAHQPWCYNGSNDGVDYGEASDLIDSLSGDPCAHWSAPSEYTADDTDGFFDGTYLHSSGCSETGWEDGIQPGWVLDADGGSAAQFLWPVFDMSTATCNTNVNGSARSTTNAQGVYTMCGDDFDLWFAQIVPTPEVTEPAPDASVTAASPGGETTVTTGAWDTGSDLTITANSDPLVLDHVKADVAGTLRKTYRLPADFPVGQHSVTIVGRHNGQPFTLTVPFSVVGLVPRFTG